MKTIEEIKALDEWTAQECEQEVHVLWITICAGREKIITDERLSVSELQERMIRCASDLVNEIVERERLSRTGVEYTPEGDLPDNSAGATLGDYLRAWSCGDDTITISK